MDTQHVAAHFLCGQVFEALKTQLRRLGGCGYLFRTFSPMIPQGNSNRSPTSLEGVGAHFASLQVIESDRRLRCQRASNCWQPSVLSPLLLPVRVSSRPKNLSWLIQSRSARNRHTQASTSNRTATGQAFAAALTLTFVPTLFDAEVAL